MNDSLERLASDLDEFGYEQDYYGYVDAIDDRDYSRKDIIEGLSDKKYVGGIINWLMMIVEDCDDAFGKKAQELLDRVKVIA